MAVSFDLFGTLIEVTSPDDPARAVATALTDRDVPVPSDWGTVYAEQHVEAAPGVELSLTDHVVAGLRSRDVAAPEETVHAALLDAFSAPVRTRPGARAAVDAATERGPVGVLSNCSVYGLVPRMVSQSGLDADAFDAIVSSVDCGWRKPDERAFEYVATQLETPLSELRHVGDDSASDGGATEAGAVSVLLDEIPLTAIPSYLERTE